ncbi:MAG: HAD family hydrolase [SAR86 cluster bacterium]
MTRLESAGTRRSNPEPIEAYIFDLDGTLLNTLQNLANCYNRVLVELGYPTHPADAYRYFIGDGARRCVERCLPASAQSPAIIDQMLALQQLDYVANWQLDAQPYAGVVAMLATLVERGAPMAVLSNKDQRFTQACVEFFFPNTPFQHIVGYSDSVPHKPDPTGAKMIAASFKTPPARIALLGDTAMDMQTAVSCGMQGLGALWGFRDAAELNAAGAQRLLNAPLDLTHISGA